MSDDLRIAVGIPSGGQVHVLWAHMYASLQWPVSGERHTLCLVKVPIANARNNMALTAIERECKYLFFIDDDVLIPNWAPKRLVYLMEQNDDWDAISGVYATKTEPPEPLIFGGEPGSTGTYWDWKMGDIFPIWGAGLGCSIIRVSSLKKLKEPYFAFTEASDGITHESQGEDLYFYKKLADAGGKVMCDGNVICGHMDRNTDKIYSLWRDSKPFKNADPDFLSSPRSAAVPNEPIASAVSKRT